MATLAEIEEQMNRVPAFRGVCMFLSNYYSVKIRYNGNEFWSAEQLYHYMKCTDYKSRFIILHANHKNLAKWGKACQLRPDWMEKRFVYMKEILRAKFHQGGRELAQRLVDTQDIKLIERNSWGETTWGVNEEGRGQNNLGKMLMEIREELKEEFDNGSFVEDYEPQMSEWDGEWKPI